MTSETSLSGLARRVDDSWSRVVLSVFGDRPGLLAFMFHAIELDETRDKREPLVDPAQTLPLESFESFISHFRTAGYSFVAPCDILAGLPSEGRYIWMTFDDGYYNNISILPVLRRHDVPATFFISSNHVRMGRAFWWDVLYRERRRQGLELEQIRQEQLLLKFATHRAIDEYLTQQFGTEALAPVGDADRPMSPSELREFSRDPRVSIGNHTCDHAILTNYPSADVVRQVEVAQADLEEITGRLPLSIAYPNGNYSQDVLELVRATGIQLGLTVEPRRNPSSLDHAEPLALGRYCFTRGFDNPESYRSYRSGASLRGLVRSLRS